MNKFAAIELDRNWCILAFTRNPFLLVVMVVRYNIKHRRIHKGFRVFPESFASTSSGFACSQE